MATTPTRLMTFEEFAQLPDPPEGHYELHHGELVLVAPPKVVHYDLQRRLRRLLESQAGEQWEIDIEMAFRPKPDLEYWTADAGAIAHARYLEGRGAGYIQGAPELVIEVLSPSNTAAEMEEKCEICLASGSREFWVVSPSRNWVTVSTPDGRSVRYTAGQSIQLIVGGVLAVDAVFGV